MTEKANDSSRKVTVSCPFCLTLNSVDVDRVAHNPKCGDCGKPILLDRPVRVTDSDFQQVISNSDVPVMVDFYADWCGPCKMVAPILEEISTEYEGKLRVFKVDTDKEQELAMAFGIQSIPSMLFIPMGEKPQMAAGALQKDALEKVIKDVLKVGAA